MATHTLERQSEPASRRCPFYVNFGFVVFPRGQIDAVAATAVKLLPQVVPMLREPFYAGQVALTLSVYQLGLAHHAVDIKYNFPNDAAAEALHAESMRDIRVIHHLRVDHFDRQQIFADEPAFNWFLNLRLSGSELTFQQRVREITGGRYPF